MKVGYEQFIRDLEHLGLLKQKRGRESIWRMLATCSVPKRNIAMQDETLRLRQRDWPGSKVVESRSRFS